MRFKSWSLEKPKNEMLNGLSVFLLQDIAYEYGLEIADKFVKKVYEEAEKFYGKFEVIQHPTFTEFRQSKQS
jgi:uncharacterized membrane protein